jgi:type II secretory pathway component PulF
MLAYPVLVLLAACLIGILFSFWIAPQFEEMFEEFGIELPEITLAVLGFAQLIRRWWWIVLAFPAGVILANWILNRMTGAHRSAGSSWIDQKLMSTRDSLASWAWHISLLLSAGLTQSEAIENAGIATGKSWLRERSEKWAKNRQPSDPANEQSFFVNPEFQLLDRAMQLPLSAGKVALLREVATFYWDRNRTIGDWWVQWLVVLILWLVGAAIFISILSLFMPLIAIVSGLTSFKS